MTFLRVSRYTTKQPFNHKKTMIMKFNNLILSSTLFFSMLFASCSNSQEASPYYESDAYGTYSNENNNYNQGNQSQSQYQDYTHVEHTTQGYGQGQPQPLSSNQQILTNQKGLSLQPLMDPQSGMPYGHYPLPASWSIKNDGWHGPNGIKVEFFYEPARSTQQVPYQSPQQFLRSKLTSLIQKEGATIGRTYNLPAIASNDKKYQEMMHLYPGQQRSEVVALGVDVNKTNESGMMIIKSTKSINPYGTSWSSSMIGLTAKDADLEKAKQTLIYALSNFQPHMPQIRQFMQREQQRTGRSWAKHNDRMRSNQRSFEATNRATQEAYAATNNATMNTYRSQSHSFDRSNQALQNGIYNENTVTNPFDGNTYQSDANYDRTFINAFGEQIQTNDQFYKAETGYQEVYPNGGGY